jgi:hypothetical protein
VTQAGKRHQKGKFVCDQMWTPMYTALVGIGRVQCVSHCNIYRKSSCYREEDFGICFALLPAKFRATNL